MSVYQQQNTQDKLFKLTRLTRDVFFGSDEINPAALNTAVAKTLKFAKELYDPTLTITAEQESHFVQSVMLLEEILEIQQRMINLQIEQVDPLPAGFASKQSNKMYSKYKNVSRGMGIGNEEEGIFSDIIKNVFKPINFILNLLKTFTPDNWRIATSKQRVYAVIGALLVLTGIAFIAAAISLGVAAPVTAAMGIGVSVAYGSMLFGIAAGVSLGIGGAFLDSVRKSVTKRLSTKQELVKMQLECNKSIELLNNKIANKPPAPSKGIDLEDRKTMTFIKDRDVTEELNLVRSEIQSIKSILKPAAKS